MIGFLLKARLKNLLFADNAILKNMLRVLLLLLTCSYGFGLAILLNFLGETGQYTLLEKVRNGVFIIVYLVILLRNVFPFYREANWLFAKLPLKPVKKVVGQLMLDTITPLMFNLLLFGIALIYSNYFGKDQFVIYLAIMLNAILTERLLKLLFEQRGKLVWGSIVIVNVASLYLSYQLWPGNATEVLTISLIAFIINIIGITLFLSNYARYRNSGPGDTQITSANNARGHCNEVKLFTTVFRKRIFVISAFASFAFKLVLFVAGNTFNGGEKLIINILTCISISPALLYTYIFNNYFGYVRQFSILVAMQPNHKLLMKAYFAALWIFLLADIFISAALWTTTKIPISIFVPGYCFVFAIFILTGFYASVNSPIRLPDQFNVTELKNSTNFGLAVVNMLLAVLIFNIFKFNLLAGYITGVVMLCAILIAITGMIRRKPAVARLYQKLFNN